MKDKQLKIILKKNMWLIALYLIGGLSISLFAFFEARYSANLIASVASDTTQTIVHLLIMCTIFGLLVCVMNIMSNTVLQYLLSKVKYQYSTYLIEHSRKLKTDTIEASSSSAITNRMITYPIQAMGWISSFVIYANNIIYHTAICIYIFCINWIFGLYMFAFFAVAITVLVLTRKKMVKYGNIARNARTYYSAINNEAINSQRDMKALNCDGYLLEKINSTHEVMDIANYKNAIYRNNVLGGNNYVWQTYMGLIPIVMSVLIGEYGLAIASAIFLTNYGAYARNLGNEIMIVTDNYLAAKVDLNSIDEFMDEKEFAVDTYGDVEIEKLRGDIEFRNVSFDYVYKYYNDAIKTDYETLYAQEFGKKSTLYDLYADDSEKEVIHKTVFKDLSFKIEAGQTVAFVGQSGSGKTTILNLIAKFSQCKSGQVLLDGVDINELSKNTLRNNICMVSQNTYIFNGTIKDNLLMVKPDATDEEIEDVCQKAYMQEFIDGLDKGIDTVVGENGIKLSGGQKQRLAIARAFLRDSAIVIFDESTSALDNEAQSCVQKSISQMRNRTVIIVAHRLSTIINADCIYYLQEGQITNKGTFDELMESDESFKELFLAENV